MTVSREGTGLVAREKSHPLPKRDARVFIRKLTQDTVRSTAEALKEFGLDKIIGQGDSVAVKVNLGGGVYRSRSTYSDPLVVEGTVVAVAALGAKPFVCEADMRGYRMNERMLRRRDLWEMLRKRGVPFVNLSEGERMRFHPHDGTIPFDIPEVLVRPGTKIVSVTVPKHHWECGVSLTQKNMYGAIADRRKAIFHRRPSRIDAVVAASARAMEPHISILGGRWVGGLLGPHFCVPVGFNYLVISNDMRAADKFMCDVLAYPFEDVRHARINLNGDSLTFSIQRGSDSIDKETLSTVASVALTPKKRRFWKSFLFGQYFLPHRLQHALGPPAEIIMSWFNRAFLRPRGDPSARSRS